MKESGSCYSGTWEGQGRCAYEDRWERCVRAVPYLILAAVVSSCLSRSGYLKLVYPRAYQFSTISLSSEVIRLNCFVESSDIYAGREK